MEFSVSATSRSPRGQEKNGIEYHFFTADEFRKMISEDKFVEYEEVYAGSFYGTLKSEVQRIWDKNHVIIFDVDAKAAEEMTYADKFDYILVNDDLQKAYSEAEVIVDRFLSE